jgi:murein DD-endopeptidase MepM/ murein hydrolase activator NlpD
MSRRAFTAAAFLAAAAVLGVDAAQADGGWRRPVDGRWDVRHRFEQPVTRYAAGHRGVDLAVAAGSLAYSPAAGTVTVAGPVAGRNVVVVEHGRLRSTFEPVDPTVEVGEPVFAGEVLGTVQPGHGHGPPGQLLLHWGVRDGDGYIDPLSLLDSAPPVLLPVWDRASATPRRPPDRTVGAASRAPHSRGPGQPLAIGGVSLAAVLAGVGAMRRG